MTLARRGDEKQILAAFLDQQLDVLVWKLDGLTDDQARQPVAPGGLYLLGLAKHVAGVAYYWLCDIFGRSDLLPSEAWSPAVSDDVEAEPGDTTERVTADVAQARTAARRAIDDLDLDATATTWLGDTVSFRWAILHVIEEAARHAGHADFIRQQIDGRTGHLPAANLPY